MTIAGSGRCLGRCGVVTGAESLPAFLIGLPAMNRIAWLDIFGSTSGGGLGVVDGQPDSAGPWSPVTHFTNADETKGQQRQGWHR